ncbi:TPA: AAA family ATPase [Enterobacter roggenkampii]|nr:AAA family ATPase [Enterobacter roggenkampii]
MKIISLTAKNTHSNLEILPVQFDNLSLLVGASGVGKTQILNAVRDVSRIARGVAVGSFKWELTFEIDNCTYFWAGETDKSKDNSFQAKAMGGFWGFDQKENRPDVVNEIIKKNDVVLINRDGLDIIFKGKKTVKLSSKESVIHSLKEEDDIRKIHEAFSSVITTTDLEMPRFPGFYGVPKNKPTHFDNLNALRNSKRPFIQKLYYCQEFFASDFEEIINSYMDIFPYVEDVAIDRVSVGHSDDEEEYFQFILKIKERGINEWVFQHDMSSGMFKTLYHISCIFLSSDGSVFLIDEFENGFGVNCIDDVTKTLISCGRNIQFIITSHHPYIINNIPASKWKIISRKAGRISAHDPSEFSLMKSNHESFTKLINLSIYQDGADR